MKKTIILTAMLAIIATACKDNKNTTAENNPQTETHQQAETTNETSVEGTYTGTLPCASCPGIETTITLAKDNTFKKTQTYLEENNTFSEEGTYSVDADIINITLKDGQKEQYKIKDGSITLLDADGKEVEGELAPNYILKKS